ncbi:MAG: RNA methyltransferase [Ignavibacteriales bacterium]|nr:RNA methyltransferase [Ignavibacteriales bacterium]
MLSKNQLKYYSSLLNKKIRQEEKKFIVEGPKLIYEAIESDFRCELVVALKDFLDENNSFVNILVKNNIKYDPVKKTELEKLCDTKTPQGVIGVFNFNEKAEAGILKDKLIVAMENISDPGNLGTIIRNCDWFGVKNVLLTSDCAEKYNPKVIRSSAGSVFHLNLFYKNNFYGVLEEQQKYGYKILCADLKGENLYHISQNEKMILLLANEANGPSEKILEICDLKITIPKKGEAESMNVASASAVLLSELTRN